MLLYRRCFSGRALEMQAQARRNRRCATAERVKVLYSPTRDASSVDDGVRASGGERLRASSAKASRLIRRREWE